ncbi:MAG: Cof-type HAD-IIB family hydrolase [Cardiobacteriaceae bacterium]|nr:Cof-type HAD-IIB family hydrolase [Cardiobacteriaceae bacterium]
MTYRAIFTDIDGTLLTSAHTISARTLAAVQRVIALGVPVILASARPPLAVAPLVAQIGGGQPFIAFNGALIFDGKGEILHSMTLDNASLRQLEPLLESRHDIAVNYYCGTAWYAPDPANRWTAQEEKITALSAARKPEEIENAHKILVMGEADTIAALEAALQARFPHLAIYRSKDTYLEIVNPAVNKAAAVRLLRERLGVARDATIAFGDHYNDLDMLRDAGYGVAMGNAPAAMQAQVAHTTAGNDEDGMALVLERLFPVDC